MHLFEYLFGHDESNPHLFSVIYVLTERSGSQYAEPSVPQTNFKLPLGYCTTSDSMWSKWVVRDVQQGTFLGSVI
jgi:hypothetical protein